jgi:hypothetical protein
MEKGKGREEVARGTKTPQPAAGSEDEGGELEEEGEELEEEGEELEEEGEELEEEGEELEEEGEEPEEEGEEPEEEGEEPEEEGEEPEEEGEEPEEEGEGREEEGEGREEEAATRRTPRRAPQRAPRSSPSPSPSPTKKSRSTPRSPRKKRPATAETGAGKRLRMGTLKGPPLLTTFPSAPPRVLAVTQDNVPEGFFEPQRDGGEAEEDVGMEIDEPSPADIWHKLPRQVMEIEAPTPRLNQVTGFAELRLEKFQYSYRAQVSGQAEASAL